jgi:hypothetical protein
MAGRLSARYREAMMEWVIVLILWIVCGIASLQIANARHAVNPMYWGVMGFLLGPFGVLAAFFAPVREE